MAYSGRGKGWLDDDGRRIQGLYHGVRRVLKVYVDDVSSGMMRPPAASDARSRVPVPSKYKCRCKTSSNSCSLMHMSGRTAEQRAQRRSMTRIYEYHSYELRVHPLPLFIRFPYK